MPKVWKLEDINIDLILSKCRKDEDGCLNWTGKIIKGFPYYGAQAKNLRRWVWEQFNDRIGNPNRVRIYNRCKNPLCLNHRHMYESYAGDVYHVNCDSEQHQGEKNGMHKLTNDDVMEIRKLKGYGTSTIYLADKYDVSKTHIHRIVNRDVWKHL